MCDIDKITDKIQKLLALAGNNPNENEAKLALLKAQKLIAKYNIDMNTAAKSGEEIKYSLEVSKVKSNPRSIRLCSIIADSFACKCVIHYKKIAFFGREDNAKASKESMEFIHRVLESGMRRVCREHGLSGTAQKGAAAIYNPYALGFISGLKEAMDAQTVALAIVVPEDVKAAFNDKFSNCKPYAARRLSLDAQERDVYIQGRTDGKSAMAKRELGGNFA